MTTYKANLRNVRSDVTSATEKYLSETRGKGANPQTQRATEEYQRALWRIERDINGRLKTKMKAIGLTDLDSISADLASHENARQAHREYLEEFQEFLDASQRHWAN
jgi:hypothetical protein